MRKMRPITEIDIQRAKEVVRIYSGANVSYLPRGNQEEIIRTFYGDYIRDKRVSQMSDAQIYSVAQKTLNYATRIVGQVKASSLEQRARAF
jgi:hypothetical protein